MRREIGVGLLTLALGCNEPGREMLPKFKCISEFANHVGDIYPDICDKFPDVAKQVAAASKKYDPNNAPEYGWCIGKLVVDGKGKNYLVYSQLHGTNGVQNHFIRMREVKKGEKINWCELIP